MIRCLALLAIAACAPSPMEGLRERVIGGVRFVEAFPHNADDRSPLIVALHGRGGSPERFSSLFRDFPATVELALAQGSIPSGQGHAWFDWSAGLTDQQFAAHVLAADDVLWPAIVALAHGRKIIIVGFSQGAVLAFAMAVRHPDDIAYVFPIAGLLPHALEPHPPASVVPVYALHGTDDATIGVAGSRNAVVALRAAGATAELYEMPGIGHDAWPARELLFARIVAALH